MKRPKILFIDGLGKTNHIHIILKMQIPEIEAIIGENEYPIPFTAPLIHSIIAAIKNVESIRVTISTAVATIIEASGFALSTNMYAKLSAKTSIEPPITIAIITACNIE